MEAGTLTLPIYKTFKLADIVEALAVMTANQHFGKIVLSVREWMIGDCDSIHECGLAGFAPVRH